MREHVYAGQQYYNVMTAELIKFRCDLLNVAMNRKASIGFSYITDEQSNFLLNEQNNTNSDKV